MDLAFTPEEQQFREEVRAWVREHLPQDLSRKVHGALPSVNSHTSDSGSNPRSRVCSIQFRKARRYVGSNCKWAAELARLWI